MDSPINEPPVVLPAVDPEIVTPPKKRKNLLSIFCISGMLHSLIVLMLILVVVSSTKPPRDEVIITTEIIEATEEIIDPLDKRSFSKEKVDVKVTDEIEVEPVVTKEEASDFKETENNMEASTAQGVENAITDSPQVGSGIMGNIGVSGGGDGSFGMRMGGGKKKAILKGGGSAKTESSVDAALRWLARHQEKDGHWDKDKYGNDKDNGGFKKSQIDADLALTGLSTLAFLSAGHTPKIGKYKNNVKSALDWILEKQLPDGSFGYSKAFNVYDNSICALALTEAYAMYPDVKLKTAAQNAINFLLNIKTAHMGMSKIPNVPLSTSVNGWLLMAFKSAKIAGLELPTDVFDKFRNRLEEVTSKDSSSYGDTVSYLELGDRKGNTKTTMTAVGMLMYEYVGANRQDLSGMAGKLVKGLPVWDANKINNDMYHWYYTTLALFQYGGDHWKTWNKAMVEVLVKNQSVGGPLDGSKKDIDGSWDSEGDYWGKNLGRIYTTAMGAFCLEVYYRYESVLH